MQTRIPILVAAIAMCAPAVAAAQTALPTYRARILAVYTSDGDPIEGAEVSDALTEDDGAHDQNGYDYTGAFCRRARRSFAFAKSALLPQRMLVNIAPDDTLPVTVMLKTTVREPPTVVTNDSAPHYLSPGLRAFDELGAPRAAAISSRKKRSGSGMPVP